VEITTVDCDAQVNPSRPTTTATNFLVLPGTSSNYAPAIYLGKGKFNWFGSSDTYLDKAHYRAQTSGQHEIYVQSVPTDGTAPTVTIQGTFKVTSDPVTSLDQLIAYVKSPTYLRSLRVLMLAYLDDARRSFKRDHTRAGVVQMQLLLEFVRAVFSCPRR
jgi:hypothetical protein